MAYGKSAFGFEDLEVYREARALRREAYKIARALSADERFALAQQMRRASISLTNNMAEGYGRYNWQETIQFFRQSRGSLMELADDLNICTDEGYVDNDSAAALKAQAETVLRLINGYISYLERKKGQAKA